MLRSLPDTDGDSPRFIKISDDGTCKFTETASKNDTDPKLAGSPANNGGPTRTMALMKGSPELHPESQERLRNRIQEGSGLLRPALIAPRNHQASSMPFGLPDRLGVGSRRAGLLAWTQEDGSPTN